jgi:hypothetical protein
MWGCSLITTTAERATLTDSFRQGGFSNNLCRYWTDGALAEKCKKAGAAAAPAINASLWNESSGYFRAWSDAKKGAPPWVMADTLYGGWPPHPLQLAHWFPDFEPRI